MRLLWNRLSLLEFAKIKTKKKKEKEKEKAQLPSIKLEVYVKIT